MRIIKKSVILEARSKLPLWVLTLIWGVLLGLSNSSALACRTGPPGKAAGANSKSFADDLPLKRGLFQKSGRNDRRPQAISNFDAQTFFNQETPWGGADKTKWTEEAVYANQVWNLLREAWQNSQIVDAVVAVPAFLMESNYHPFSDGQSNAKLCFHKNPTNGGGSESHLR